MDMEHERRLTETEARSKSNTKRIDEMEEKQRDIADLVSSVKVLADREVRVESDVKEIKDDVKELKGKPGKLWESILEKAIFTIVGGIITYVLIRLGLQ
jgi:predicted  nucleic acid-binding Zn-ribbon protein